MKNTCNTIFKLSVFIVLACFLGSCASIKNYKYFKDISDTTKLTKIYNDTYREPVIQSDDILYIAIQTIDPIAGNSINSLNSINSQTSGAASNTLLSSTAITGNQSAIYGYLVDKQGSVKVPVIGDIHLSGLTTTQARVLITEKAARFYKDPSVIVRYANFKITVLGEVQRPGIYSVPNEKVTVLDALGYAGDLTIYAKRDNILLLRRHEDGSMYAMRLDLTNSALLKSPYFYLKQNDELYVEPSKGKINSSDAAQVRNISIITGAISILIIILTRTR